jgi:hypothetical protein
MLLDAGSNYLAPLVNDERTGSTGADVNAQESNGSSTLSY